MLCHPFSLTVPRTEPELDDQRVDGEANPERDPEKLLWLKMCQTAGGKEYAHHRTRSDDSKKNRYCPYHPDAVESAYRRVSDWRKPQPGMLLRAAEDLALDLGRSWMIGDRLTDAEAGRRAGLGTVLIGSTDERTSAVDHVARDLEEAARVILAA